MHAHDEEFEARLTRSLEAAPQIAVPVDFAARVMARVPQREMAVPTRVSNAARSVALASIAVLACVLLVLMFAIPQTRFVSFALEPLLAMQLAGLLYWQAVRPRFQ